MAINFINKNYEILPIISTAVGISQLSGKVCLLAVKAFGGSCETFGALAPTFKALEKRSFIRVCASLIPVIGNIAIYIFRNQNPIQAPIGSKPPKVGAPQASGTGNPEGLAASGEGDDLSELSSISGTGSQDYLSMASKTSRSSSIGSVAEFEYIDSNVFEITKEDLCEALRFFIQNPLFFNKSLFKDDVIILNEHVIKIADLSDADVLNIFRAFLDNRDLINFEDFNQDSLDFIQKLIANAKVAQVVMMLVKTTEEMVARPSPRPDFFLPIHSSPRRRAASPDHFPLPQLRTLALCDIAPRQIDPLELLIPFYRQVQHLSAFLKSIKKEEVKSAVRSYTAPLMQESLALAKKHKVALSAIAGVQGLKIAIPIGSSLLSMVSSLLSYAIQNPAYVSTLPVSALMAYKNVKPELAKLMNLMILTFSQTNASEEIDAQFFRSIREMTINGMSSAIINGLVYSDPNPSLVNAVTGLIVQQLIVNILREKITKARAVRFLEWTDSKVNSAGAYTKSAIAVARRKFNEELLPQAKTLKTSVSASCVSLMARSYTKALELKDGAVDSYVGLRNKTYAKACAIKNSSTTQRIAFGIFSMMALGVLAYLFQAFSSQDEAAGYCFNPPSFRGGFVHAKASNGLSFLPGSFNSSSDMCSF